MPGSPLGNPAWTALDGPHSAFAERKGRVLRYPVEISPFLAVPDDPDPAVWQDIADLVAPATTATVVGGVDLPLPAGWTLFAETPAVQMKAEAHPVPPEAASGSADPANEVTRLTVDDVPEMLDLAARTRPGPFRPRTIELGTYLGIHRDGTLAAMAGERLHPPGWTEISAVCTDPAFQGQGLAARLVREVMAEIRTRGERPFLHAATANVGAIRLYERLGFRFSRAVRFSTYRVPEG
ncbi:GNAT family N-acetyltransferase [Amycolatopsis panacis]|uniref:GNAT family N-acetyltransferase n=1 Tax=Amycolatopsis panacis TaxID=2340917 RepID=A0A419I541_9PSEU|nr:GNAT family N-acetyltransferase [Amycolatopsis panacis]RJQ85586.1 GNAT family N-acetyltransferase [Amycolatopsis panacis]